MMVQMTLDKVILSTPVHKLSLTISPHLCPWQSLLGVFSNSHQTPIKSISHFVLTQDLATAVCSNAVVTRGQPAPAPACSLPHLFSASGHM